MSLQILREHYSAYCYFLRSGDFKQAALCAVKYNAQLKRLGGERKNHGEYYLSMGKTRKVKAA